MRKANVYVQGKLAGYLLEQPNDNYQFIYQSNYTGAPISLTMPRKTSPYDFQYFPPFFEGLLPEGMQLEALLKQAKLDRNDYFGQLLAVGSDMVGFVTVEETHEV